MTTTLELHVRKIQWFCQQGEGFCMHVFSSSIITTLSDLIDRRIDFGQWEFCVVWATRISLLDVLSAVPPFLSHARKSKPAERRDRSQSKSFMIFLNN